MVAGVIEGMSTEISLLAVLLVTLPRRVEMLPNQPAVRGNVKGYMALNTGGNQMYGTQYQEARGEYLEKQGLATGRTVNYGPIDPATGKGRFSYTAYDAGTKKDGKLTFTNQTRDAMATAKKNEIPIFLDLDFRANLWENILDFGSVLRDYLKLTDIVIGTEEEVLSLNLTDIKQVRIKNDSITQPKIAGNLNDSIKIILNEGVKLLLVKTGAKGVIAYYNDGSVLKVPGFSVKVTNVLGAGDAFAGGFIYGYLNGWDDYKSLRLANACGAWLVTKQGCCNFAPYYDEIINFIEEKGGF